VSVASTRGQSATQAPLRPGLIELHFDSINHLTEYLGVSCRQILPAGLRLRVVFDGGRTSPDAEPGEQKALVQVRACGVAGRRIALGLVRISLTANAIHQAVRALSEGNRRST
jgi:hypothetical protein